MNKNNQPHAAQCDETPDPSHKESEKAALCGAEATASCPHTRDKFFPGDGPALIGANRIVIACREVGRVRLPKKANNAGVVGITLEAQSYEGGPVPVRVSGFALVRVSGLCGVKKHDALIVAGPDGSVKAAKGPDGEMQNCVGWADHDAEPGELVRAVVSPHGQIVPAQKPIKRPQVQVFGDLPAETVGALVKAATRAIDAEERQPVTPERLAEWEALEQAATPGPWRFYCEPSYGSWISGPNDESDIIHIKQDGSFEVLPEDGQFMVQARNGMVRDLCAEVRRAWETETLRVDENQRLRGLLAEANEKARNAKLASIERARGIPVKRRRTLVARIRRAVAVAPVSTRLAIMEAVSEIVEEELGWSEASE